MFASSLCTLVLEIVAGRVLAPTIGVSLFTWTSVIGVVLAGVAGGNYVGGVMARRSAVPATLGGVPLAAGLAVWAIALLIRMVRLGAIFSGWPALARIVALVATFSSCPAPCSGW